MDIRAELAGSCGHKRPWLAYRDGKMLRTKKGVGRRFKTKKAAEKAAIDDTAGI